VATAGQLAAGCLTEQHRDELDLENVEQSSLQALLGCVGAVKHDISIACGRFACSAHAAMPSVTNCTRSWRLSVGAVWVGTKIGTPS
jgi:hypothetical protein